MIKKLFFIFFSVVLFTACMQIVQEIHAGSVEPFIGISTFAGSESNGDGLPAVEARLFTGPTGNVIKFNSNGDMYLTDALKLRKISSNNNIMSTVTGTSPQASGDVADGQPATNALFQSLQGLDIDSNGEIYLADYNTCKIKKITNDGKLFTIAGTGPGKNNDRSISGGFIGDGALANETQLGYPHSIVFHPISGELYMAETQSYKIRKIDRNTNRVVTVVGTGKSGFSGDNGLAIDAQIGSPSNFVFDSMGNMYLSDGNRVRKVLTNGTIITVAGNGNGFGLGDTNNILALDATLARPSGLAISSTGELYIAEYYGNRIRKVLTNGTITLFAGTGAGDFSGDGDLAVNAHVSTPDSLVLNGDYLYFSDTNNYRIRRVSLSTGIISTVAGGGVGDSREASVYGYLVAPNDVKKGPNGNVLIADSSNSRIRSVSNKGIISTVAGKGAKRKGILRSAFGGEQANSVQLNYPAAIAVRSDNGDFYFTDTNDRKIRMVSNIDGTISTVLGSSNYGFSEDGTLAIDAWVGSLSGLAINSLGEVVFSDESFNRIRKILNNGTLVTISGWGDNNNNGQGFGGDGDLAQYATLSSPNRVFISPNDDIYFADQANFRFRKIFANNGTITTIAGNGNQGYGPDDVLAIESEMQFPQGIAMNSLGELIFADSTRIRKITLEGYIVTIAGSDVAEFSGDGGLAVNAKFKELRGLFVDSNDDIYVSDTGSMRIRKISLMCPTGYVLQGKECLPTCYGMVSNDISVCSGKGTCNETNTCNCSPSYYGNKCELFNCSGISFNSSLVCSSHGQCSSPNVCKCENGYFGATCEQFNCFAINSQNTSQVCSSQGNCTSPDKCICKTGYSGYQCESFNCNGIKNNDQSVCSSRGQCISPDVCKCTMGNSYGKNCELMIQTSTNIMVVNATKSTARLNDGNVQVYSFLLLAMMFCFLQLIFSNQ